MPTASILPMPVVCQKVMLRSDQKHVVRLIVKSIGRACGGLAAAVLLASASLGQEGREIARNAFPSVVLIVADNGKTHRASLGSGFFVQDDLIVTNYHVVKGSSRVRVKLVGKRDTYRVQVVATSAAKDLALLRVVGVQATPLSLGDLGQVAIGDEVYAIGNPEGLEATLSQGIISGIRQMGGNRYFQISAPISHGSSGGPILNKSGEVIGVAVGTLRSGQNLNSAIPISEVTSLMNQAVTQTRDAEERSASAAPPQPAHTPRPSAAEELGAEEINRALKKVRQQPNSSEAHFELAETYRGWMLTEKAIAEYKRVLQLKPDYPAAYFGLADSWLTAEWTVSSLPNPAETAITYFKQAIRLDPDYLEAHVGLGKAYRELGRYDEAIAAFQLAIRIRPDSVKAYRGLGEACYFDGRYDQAIDAFKTASALDPRNSTDYSEMGWAYTKSGRCEQAMSNYKQAINLRGENGAAQAGLLECYTRTSSFADGIEYFKQLIVSLGEKPIGDGMTTSTYARYHLGMLYVRSGDTKAALEQYKILTAQGKGSHAPRCPLLFCGNPADLAEKLFTQISK